MAKFPLFQPICHPVKPKVTLETIAEQINKLTKQIMTLQDEIDQLKVTVTNNTSVEQSALDVLNGITAKIAAAVQAALAAGATPDQLQAINDQLTILQNNNVSLATAVAANTTVAPAPAA